MSVSTRNLPLPKLLNYITKFPDTLPILEQKLSVQTYIPPDSQSYKLHNYDKCYASNGLTATLNMKPVDNNLHTVDDCVKIAHEAGINSFIQPGGSVRDKDSVDYCVQNNLAMVMTGLRHFRH